MDEDIDEDPDGDMSATNPEEDNGNHVGNSDE